MSEPAAIAFLGVGNMGEAMLRGLLKAGHPGPLLQAYDTRTERLLALAGETGFRACSGPAQALEGASVVVLAVKPQSMDALLAQVGGALSPGQTVVSIAAGVTLERLARALPPGTPLVRVMPNTPGLIGRGVSAFCLSLGTPESAAAVVEALLAPLGAVLRVDEARMDAVTALSGSGPAYVFLFMEALQAAGEALGLPPEAAFTLAARTLDGAAAMVLAGERAPRDLRAAVTSPGGTTAAALKVLEEGGFVPLVARALAAARDRSAELGRLP